MAAGTHRGHRVFFETQLNPLRRDGPFNRVVTIYRAIGYGCVAQMQQRLEAWRTCIIGAGFVSTCLASAYMIAYPHLIVGVCLQQQRRPLGLPLLPMLASPGALL